MAGLGFVGAGGAAGMTDALKEIVAQRLLEKKLEEQRMQQEFENRMATRQADTGDSRFAQTFGQTVKMDDANLGLRTRDVELNERGLGHRISQDVRGNTIEDKALADAAQKELGRISFIQKRMQQTGNPAFEALTFGMNPEDVMSGNELGTKTAAQRKAEWEGHGRTERQETVDMGTRSGIAQSNAAAANRPAPGPRPATGIQKQAVSFYNRARAASEDIAPLEEQISGLGLGSQARMAMAPNAMQSQLGQSYRQAQKAFTEARLRKESGAAIAQSEYDNDAVIYFAQPGDTPETLAQKRAAREEVLDGLAFAAGPAFEEFFGVPFERGVRGNAAKPSGVIDAATFMKGRKPGGGR